MKRKLFLASVSGSVLTIWLQGCGGGGGGYGSPPPPPPPAGGSPCGAGVADITANHGHSLSIPKADLDASVDQTYSLAPSFDGHTHAVTFTVAELRALKSGSTVTVVSAVTVASGLYGGSHSHDVAAAVNIATCA